MQNIKEILQKSNLLKNMKNTSISEIFFRIFPSVIGGFLGTLAFLGAFLLLQLPLSDNSAYSVFSVLVISFTGAIIGNLLATVFMIISNKGKFNSMHNSLNNIFLTNILLFLALIPFILISDNDALSVVGFYFIFSAFISSIIIEILSKSLSVLAVVFPSLIAFVLLMLFSKMSADISGASIMVLLFILPISWLLFSAFAVLGDALEKMIIKGSSDK